MKKILAIYLVFYILIINFLPLYNYQLLVLNLVNGFLFSLYIFKQINLKSYSLLIFIIFAIYSLIYASDVFNDLITTSDYLIYIIGGIRILFIIYSFILIYTSSSKFLPILLLIISIIFFIELFADKIIYIELLTLIKKKR